MSAFRTWGPLDAAARKAAEQLTNAFTNGYTDPAEALNNRPCLLVAPPTLDFTAGTMDGPLVRLRIIALSSYSAGTFDALAELDPLIATADEAFGIERAEPIQYPLGKDRVAAYLITTTDYPFSTEESA